MNLRQACQHHRLEVVLDKVDTGDRLTLEEGEHLYQCQDPVLLGELAHRARTRRHGERTTYVLNQQINYTNICVNACLFCSYRRSQDHDGGFTLHQDQIREKLESQLSEPIRELHIVGACHPEHDLEHYVRILRTARRVRPQATLKAFTPVEIDHFAAVEGCEPEDVLQRLRDEGLQMLPGGGAEIFDPEVRRQICPHKASGERWLDISRRAHKLGIQSNATMLFGHLEGRRHRLQHMDALRRLQDETGGFLCFIPLPFQTRNNPLGGVEPITGLEELRTIAVSRLMLDNIPHIKSYWVMLGLPQAQAALCFGADDLDGTVVEERIGHTAGADSPQVLDRGELEAMIRGCGQIPVERNGIFERVQSL